MTANLTGGSTAGVVMGAYHHAKPDAGANDAVNEANWFVSQAGNYIKPGYLRPALDVSEGAAGTSGGTLSKAQLSIWVNTFLSTVKDATGVDPIVYVNNDYATTYLDSTVAANHDLWIARWSTAYGDPTTTGSPPTGVWGGVGESWRMWQYTSTGTVSGVSGSVDRDVFNGDRAALDQFVIGGSGTSSFSLKLDFGPTGSSVPAGYVNVAGDVFGLQSGQQMGWLQSGAATYTRTAGTAPDNRYRTYVMPALNSVSRAFEVAVPNGSYTVHVVTGSPDQYPNAQKITVEGVTAVNASTSSTVPFVSGTVTVNVTDGKLTLGSDYNGWANTRLDFVDIVGNAPGNTGLQTSVKFAPKYWAAVPGYTVDSGDAAGLHSNGRTFGWVDAATGVAASNLAAFDRGGEVDQRKNGGIATSGKTWEIDVPNGTYYVKLVAGDPNITSGTYGYGVADNNNFLSGTAGSGDARWITATGTVTVTDGRLTIRNAPGVTNHALAYVEITDALAKSRSTVNAPTDVIANDSADNVTDVRWTDRSDNELGFKVERATSLSGPWTMLGDKPEHPGLSTFANAGFYEDGVTKGVTYYYRVTAVKTGASSASTVSNPLSMPDADIHSQKPYNPKHANWTAGSIIQAEDYDVGGKTVAYDDRSGGNAGGYYRSGLGDIGFNVQNGRYFVGWQQVNEWQEYTVDVPGGGEISGATLYRLEVSAASDGQGGKLSMFVDGAQKVANLQVPNTGSMTEYQTVQSGLFTLAPGTGHVVRIFAATPNSSGDWVGDLDWIKLVPVGVAPGVSIVSSPSQVEEGTPVVFTVILNNAQGLTKNITVPLQVSGDFDGYLSSDGAYSSNQFSGEIPTSVTFHLPAGIGFGSGQIYTQSFVITPVVDSFAEGDESISVRVRPAGTYLAATTYPIYTGIGIPPIGLAGSYSGGSYSISPNNSSATVTILANDGTENDPGGSTGGGTAGNSSNPVPTIVSPATASSGNAVGTTVDLSIGAVDNGGPSNLTYTWSVASAPNDAPTPSFNVNSASDAATATATFFKAGKYVFSVQVTDADGNTVDGDDVTVFVPQTLTSAAVTPISLAIAAGGTYPFTAVGYDQFGDEINSVPSWQWSVDPSPAGGKITWLGVYTAPNATQPTAATIRVTGGGVSAQASVVIAASIASPSSVTAVGADDSSVLHVTWVDQASTEDSYLVSVYSTKGVLVASQVAAADATSAEVGGLPEGTAYRVVVAAVVNGLPPASMASPNLAYTRLAKPTNATAVRNGSTVHVTWTDASKHELGYLLKATAMQAFADATGATIPAGTVLKTISIDPSAGGASGEVLSGDLSAVATGVDVLIEIVAEASVAERSSISASVPLTNGGGVSGSNSDPWTGIVGKKDGYELTIGANQNSSVDITGVPIPEPSPTGEGESDRTPSPSRVEMYGLTPSFSATDVSVPMPGGEISLEIRRNQSIQNSVFKDGLLWGNFGSGLSDALSNFQWESEYIFGATWSSNLAIRAIQTTGGTTGQGEPPIK